MCRKAPTKCHVMFAWIMKNDTSSSSSSEFSDLRRLGGFRTDPYFFLIVSKLMETLFSSESLFSDSKTLSDSSSESDEIRFFFVFLLCCFFRAENLAKASESESEKSFHFYIWWFNLDDSWLVKLVNKIFIYLSNVSYRKLTNFESSENNWRA